MRRFKRESDEPQEKCGSRCQRRSWALRVISVFVELGDGAVLFGGVGAEAKMAAGSISAPQANR
jgi:hypothetical protein